MTACTTGPRIDEVRFAAMGTTAHLVVVGGRPGLLDLGQERIAELEARWSRFLETSEVSELNRGGPQRVSSDTWLLVSCGIVGWERTAGRFDPTVHDAVIAAGYPGLRTEPEPQGPTPPFATSLDSPAPGCAAIRTDRGTQTIEFPAEVRFDPGGIGKGLAADLVSGELLEAGASGVLASLGGDLRARGQSPRGEAWTIDIAEPDVSASPIAHVALGDGAVATSTTERRQWSTDGDRRHHLIDPVTGRPSDRSIRLASVVTRHAWWAEVSAKQLFVVPPSEIDNCLIDAEAIVVDDHAVAHRSAGFAGFER